jgi:pimeloyl-ACP methyl ester carboxylesterase
MRLGLSLKIVTGTTLAAGTFVFASSRRQKTLLIPLVVAAGTYIALSPAVLANYLLFLPARCADYDAVPKRIFGAVREDAVFKAPDGKVLHGIIFRKPFANKFVLLHHGQGGNLMTHLGLAKTVLLSGCSVMIYDYEGFGESEGCPSVQGILQDGDAAYDYVISKKLAMPNQLIQCGFSLGTGVACHIAETKPCAGVILISSYQSLNMVAQEKFPYLRLYPESLQIHPSIGTSNFFEKNTRIPVLLIHGANDQLINSHHSIQARVTAKCPCRLVLDPKCHHGDYSTVFLANQIRRFVRDFL